MRGVGGIGGGRFPSFDFPKDFISKNPITRLFHRVMGKTAAQPVPAPAPAPVKINGKALIAKLEKADAKNPPFLDELKRAAALIDPEHMDLTVNPQNVMNAINRGFALWAKSEAVKRDPVEGCVKIEKAIGELSHALDIRTSDIAKKRALKRLRKKLVQGTPKERKKMVEKLATHQDISQAVKRDLLDTLPDLLIDSTISQVEKALTDLEEHHNPHAAVTLVQLMENLRSDLADLPLTSDQKVEMESALESVETASREVFQAEKNSIPDKNRVFFNRLVAELRDDPSNYIYHGHTKKLAHIALQELVAMSLEGEEQVQYNTTLSLMENMGIKISDLANDLSPSDRALFQQLENKYRLIIDENPQACENFDKAVYALLELEAEAENLHLERKENPHSRYLPIFLKQVQTAYLEYKAREENLPITNKQNRHFPRLYSEPYHGYPSLLEYLKSMQIAKTD